MNRSVQTDRVNYCYLLLLLWFALHFPFDHYCSNGLRSRDRALSPEDGQVIVIGHGWRYRTWLTSMVFWRPKENSWNVIVFEASKLTWSYIYVILSYGESKHARLLCFMKPQVSLNEKDWDTHVSFTVMSLAASRDGKYLLGATDKSRWVPLFVRSFVRLIEIFPLLLLIFKCCVFC